MDDAPRREGPAGAFDQGVYFLSIENWREPVYQMATLSPTLYPAAALGSRISTLLVLPSTDLKVTDGTDYLAPRS